MSFIRRYWIAGLVILLVTIHAIIIGYVRAEATRLKTVASSEIPIGLFYKQSNDRQWLTQMRIHVQVPPEQRLVAKATIEHNRWVVHEAVEEAIRPLEESLLLDPSLVAVKAAIKQAIDEVLHEELVERIVINDRVDLDVREFHWRPSSDLITPGEETKAAKSSTLTSVRPVRPSLSERGSENSQSHGDEEGAAGDDHSSADGDGEHDAHAPAHAPASSHATPSAHATPAAHAKPAASHAAKKPAAHAPAKSSGHSAKKATSSHGAAKKASSGH